MLITENVIRADYTISCASAVENFREAGISARVRKIAKYEVGIKLLATGIRLKADKSGRVTLDAVRSLIGMIAPDTAPIPRPDVLTYYTDAETPAETAPAAPIVKTVYKAQKGGRFNHLAGKAAAVAYAREIEREDDLTAAQLAGYGWTFTKLTPAQARAVGF